MILHQLNDWLFPSGKADVVSELSRSSMNKNSARRLSLLTPKPLEVVLQLADILLTWLVLFALNDDGSALGVLK